MNTTVDRLSAPVSASPPRLRSRQDFPLFSRRTGLLLTAVLCALGSTLIALVLSLPDAMPRDPFTPYRRHPERLILDCPFFHFDYAREAPCSLMAGTDFYIASLRWAGGGQKLITFIPRNLRYGDLLVLYGEPVQVRRGTSLYHVRWREVWAYIHMTAPTPAVDARVRSVTLRVENSAQTDVATEGQFDQ